MKCCGPNGKSLHFVMVCSQLSHPAPLFIPDVLPISPCYTRAHQPCVWSQWPLWSTCDARKAQFVINDSRNELNHLFFKKKEKFESEQASLFKNKTLKDTSKYQIQALEYEWSHICLVEKVAKSKSTCNCGRSVELFPSADAAEPVYLTSCVPGLATPRTLTASGCSKKCFASAPQHQLNQLTVQQPQLKEQLVDPLINFSLTWAFCSGHPDTW